LTETPAYFLVDAQDDDAGKELGEHGFTPGGILGKVHTLHNSATEIILKASPCARSACRRRVMASTPLKWSITQSVSIRKDASVIGGVSGASLPSGSR
jgi:hypothetical protein